MKTLVVMATWVCWAILVLILPVLVRPSTIEETLAAPRPRPRPPPPPPPPSPDDSTVPLNLDEPKTYPSFLASLRPKLTAGGSIVCGIPETPSRKTVPVSKRFVLVDLKTKDLVFTLAIDVASAYVVAYRDNKKVGYFFNLDDKEANEVAKNLFKGGTRKELEFGESYKAMEKFTKEKDREKIPLGANKLAKAIINLNNYESKDKKDDKLKEYQATFLLIAIQMVSEAARFPYIEQKVVDNEKYGFKPDVKTTSLEKNWGSLSKGIQGSSAKPIPYKCKDMGRTVTINIGKNGEKMEVKTVDQARNVVNFIKRDEDTDKLRSISQFDQIISSIVAQDGDAFATVLEAGNNL